MVLTEQNYLLFAAGHYWNPNCVSTDEFLEDLKRIRYIKKLLYTYRNKGVLRDRLILNHLVILYNVFEPKACTKMLFFRLEEYFDMLKPFLEILGYCPKQISGIGVENRIINTDDYFANAGVVEELNKIVRGE